MSAKEPKAEKTPAKGGGKKKLLLLAAPLVLIGAGAGLWFSGVLPSLLGHGKEEHGEAAEGHGHGAPPAHGTKPEAAAHGGEGAGAHAKAEGAGGHATVFVDLPEMIANLNAGPRRTSFVKFKAKLELARAEDQAAVTAAMPRLVDLFQTYLREMRPEELRGAAGTYRLREELIARATIAAAPARVSDVLFVELLVQ